MGKTSLIRRYVYQSFSENYLMTIGTHVSKRVDEVSLLDGRTVEVSLTIWDIMGQRKFLEMLQEAYFDGARGCLAVFDLTRAETLEGLTKWVEAARQEEARIPILVLGNKADLEAKRAVSDEEANRFCGDLRLAYMATSALTGLNVEAAFRHLALEAVRTFSKRRTKAQGPPGAP